MRRSMGAMLMVTAALSTPLAAQSAWSVGFAGTLGGSWQVEALEVGYLKSVRAGPLRSVMVGGRGGTFIDEGAIANGSRGFVGGVVVALRTGLARLADVGGETNTAPVGFDLTLEAAGFGGVNSPLPEGSGWAAVSALPGVRFGGGDGARYGLMIWPTVYLGRTTRVHAFLGLRFELPAARRRR